MVFISRLSARPTTLSHVLLQPLIFLRARLLLAAFPDRRLECELRIPFQYKLLRSTNRATTSRTSAHDIILIVYQLQHLAMFTMPTRDINLGHDRCLFRVRTCVDRSRQLPPLQLRVIRPLLLPRNNHKDIAAERTLREPHLWL